MPSAEPRARLAGRQPGPPTGPEPAAVGRRWLAALRGCLPALLLALSLLAPAAQARDNAGAGVASGASIALAELPPEARVTLALIRAGGPFPYDKDGTVFGNREGLLPRQARGYYTEYTVRTPGSRDRGARRIVAGGDPRRSGEYWYTGDHYRSFQRIRE
ncbi:MAG: ribonuclease [Betaproteobacteria bacterium]|nr:ribonuclease [Betaproteobacteria bacterium]